jgi:N utilization substance protein B
VPLGSRREARERALELLYESELKEQKTSEVLAELPVEPARYAMELVVGIEEHQAEIDQVISRHAIDWALGRMPVVDRALLRIATFELLHRPDVPTGAVISEAVELAKAYSTEESASFVNGLLAAVSHEARPAAAAPEEPPARTAPEAQPG